MPHAVYQVPRDVPRGICELRSPAGAQAATGALTILHILPGSWGTWEAWIYVNFS